MKLILHSLLYLYFAFGIIQPTWVCAIDQQPSNRNDLVVKFKKGSIELDRRSIDMVFAKMVLGKSYLIQAYSCDSDKGSVQMLIAVADRRATTVREALVLSGFPPGKLVTIAYDHDRECKAVITIRDDRKKT